MLRLYGVRKEFGERTLFENVSFALAPGHRIALVGGNGSGKSTLLKICAQLIEPDAGSVQLDAASHLAYLPQIVGGTGKSGGEKQKQALSNVFRERSTLVLLDEPTNNLDETTVHWLETAIRHSSAGFLIVSHDREFLDSVTNQTYEIEPQAAAVNTHGGQYSLFKQAKESALHNQWRIYSVQQQKFKQLKEDALAIKQQARQTEKSTQNDYIRGRAKKVAAKAKAREKRLEHLMQEEKRVAKPRDIQRIRLAFAPSRLTERALVELKNVSCGFESKAVLNDVNLQLYTGQRVAITGNNGAGKSCLLNLIAAKMEPLAGSIWRWGGATISYFPQSEPIWDNKLTVVQWLQEEIGSLKFQIDLRTYLHRFLFTRDDVYKQLGTLSCGERTRLTLASIMIHNPDLILFDEPTNHLDIESIESIEDALSQYNGAILIVSHDRSFRQSIAADTIWHVEAGKVQMSPILPETQDGAIVAGK